MKLGPSSGPAVSSLEVYTTPTLSGDRDVIGAPLREGVLQTLTEADTHERQVPGIQLATVTQGKRVSRKFCVAQERSLAGTLGNLSISHGVSAA